MTKQLISYGFFLLTLASLPGCSPTPPPSPPASPDPARAAESARNETARAFELIAQQKYAEAEAPLKQAIDADPQYGPAHNDLGLVYYRLNRPYEAAWELEKSIKLMPRQPEPQNNLGLVFEQAGRLTDALASFTRASQLDPDNPNYLGNLARVRIRLGMRDDETRRALELLLTKETRPEWLAWARLTLIQLRLPMAGPTTRSLPGE